MKCLKLCLLIGLLSRVSWVGSEAVLASTLSSVFIKRRNVSCNLPTFRQQQMCLREPRMQWLLHSAVQLAETYCQHCFPHQARVCPNPSPATFSKMSRETAVMYALYSAALAYTMSKACGRGELSLCPKPSYNNISFGIHFTRGFLLINRPLHPTLESDVTQRHNTLIGINVIKSSQHDICECVGIMRSCLKRRCYKKLKPFTQIALTLRSAYVSAVYLRPNNKAKASYKRRLYRERLLYTDRSRPECSPAGYQCYHRTHCYSRCCAEDFYIQQHVTSSYCYCYWIAPFQLNCDLCNTTRLVYICM